MTSVLWSGLNSPGKEEAHTQVPTPGWLWVVWGELQLGWPSRG